MDILFLRQLLLLKQGFKMKLIKCFVLCLILFNHSVVANVQENIFFCFSNNDGIDIALDLNANKMYYSPFGLNNYYLMENMKWQQIDDYYPLFEIEYRVGGFWHGRERIKFKKQGNDISDFFYLKKRKWLELIEVNFDLRDLNAKCILEIR